MLISPSSEFVALCRTQIALLTQGLGAALSVVYLTEELVEGGTAQAKLIPVVAYPETAVGWEGSNVALLPEETRGDTQPLLLSETLPQSASAADPSPSPELRTDTPDDEYQLNDHSLVQSTQIVLPLMHEGEVMGLLVTAREDRPWNDRERGEIERIAQTLTLARLLDQRREWFEQQLKQQQRLKAKQRDLLDNLLHQFRNPLTALRTFGKLLLKRLIPEDANRAVADNIVRESDRLQELLQQFDQVIELTVDEIDREKSLPAAGLTMEATVQPQTKSMPLLPNAEGTAELCSVASVLKPLLASARAIAGERNLDLQADIPPNLPPVRANAQALLEVLSNLIDNALKYTPTGGQVYIQAGQKQDHYQGIAISDTGPGIPLQDLEHIFERHYRGVQAESEIPGTGLGLAIAKDLIEQMHGKIQVFSPAVSRALDIAGEPGATFIVWLPIG